MRIINAGLLHLGMGAKNACGYELGVDMLVEREMVVIPLTKKRAKYAVPMLA